MFDSPLQHVEGDVFFDYRIGGRAHRIQVTGDCLVSLFQSDGSITGNERALRQNFERILRVAADKVSRGVFSPIQIRPVDF